MHVKMNYEILTTLVPFLSRKTKCRIRSLSKMSRDAVPKPKPFKKLDTTGVAKVKMILNLGKTLGGTVVRLVQGGSYLWEEVIVRYNYEEFTLRKMLNTFTWFKMDVCAKIFFLAYKFLEYDSKMVSKRYGYQYNVQIGDKNAEELLAFNDAYVFISPQYIAKL